MARWKPKIGETYYHVNRDGVPTKETWNDGVLDNHRYNHGNCYDSLRLEIKTDPIDKKSIVGKLFQVWWSTKRGDNMAMVLDVLPYTGKYIQYFDAILVLEPRANSLYSNKPIQMSVQLKDCKFFDVGSWPSTTPWKPNYGDTYFYINDKGEATETVWGDNPLNHYHYDSGNRFKTKGDALKHRKDVEDFRRQNNL